MKSLRALQLASAAAIVATASFVLPGTAGAAQYDIHISPSSGPAGTSVSMSGANCSPGVSVDANADYVRLVSTLFTVQVNVAANGSWHTSAIVGGLPVPGPAPITATCFTDGSPSQDTQYNPAVFTVTSGTASPPTTHSGSTPTTKPGGGSNGGGSNGGGSNGGGSNGGGSSGGGASNGGAGSNGAGGGSGSRTGAASGAGGGGSGAAAAGATTPTTSRDGVVDALGVGLGNDGSKIGGGGSGLAWMWWLLLIFAAAAATGLAWVAWWRRRDHALTEADQV
jgi:hypothetical protein